MADPFSLSHDLVEEWLVLDPILATLAGVPGHDHRWPDLGPDGMAAEQALVERYLGLFEPHLNHPDRWQRLAATIAHAYLRERHAQFAAGDHLYDVSHMGSSFDFIRSVFDLMDTARTEGWEAICARLGGMDTLFDGYRAKLDVAMAAGKVATQRQTRSLIAQSRELGGEDSSLIGLVAQAPGIAPADLVQRLTVAVESARAACRAFADHLETAYLPAAGDVDGVGVDRYRRAADAEVGLDIDPHEVYRWGWQELGRILTEMERVGAEILPGASVRQVADLLESDPTRAAPNRAAFVEFVQARQTQALADLDGPHFDVPDAIKAVSVNIAPPGGPLGAYYMGPSEDFVTRPGGIWYSLPPEDGPIPLYQEVSTAYHEGFPGHHLQVALVMTFAERLSRFHRLVVWYAGYGEGWALYTERLMHELGYFEKPDYVFGMLASHVFRAARVVVDIGLHLGLRIPDDAPLHAGSHWDYDKAVDYMMQIGLQPGAYAESEVQRYLGWPGQAISYKVGEREILALRDELRRRLGDDFDLKDFHARVLGHGEMRLDLLRRVVLEGWE
ncbi:MAG: DUF885 domain-containing protein [Acidimicrobiia bacterium]